MIRAALFLAGILFAVVPAWAQGVVPTGTFTPGHTYRVQDPSGTVASDAGGSAGSSIPGNGYLTELGITNTGTPFCINDALINAPGGYHQFCIGANALGGGLISYNAYAGASPLSLLLNINGSTVSFPGSGNGDVLGPNSSGIGNIPIWNNTGGTLLADAGKLSGPAWTTGTYGTYDGARMSINNYPLSNEFGGNSPSVPIVQGLVGTLSVPSNAVGANSGGNGVAGYCQTASTTFNCTGVFGFGGATATGATLIAGGAFLVANGPFPQVADGNGLSIPGGMQGIEVDVNFVKGPGSSIPASTDVYGIRVTGGSTVDPSGNGGLFAGAFVADSPGVQITPHLKWATDFDCIDGSTVACLNIGKQNSSGSSNPGQFIGFSATNSGNVGVSGSVGMDITGSINWNIPGAYNWQIGGTTYFSVTSGSTVIGNGSLAAPASSPVLFFEAYSGSLINSSVQLTSAGAFVFNAPAGGTVVSEINASPILTLQSTGPVINTIPASAGGGGLFVCVDSSGVLYKKATCP
jgi:hypothetical protein